jgi:hypothetical protein
VTVEELNALVEDAYVAAFEYEEELTQVYATAFERASKKAVRTFRQDAVTAAGFVAPPIDSLTEGMTEAEQAKANGVRDRAALAIAAALTALGLTAVAVSFMRAIAERGSLNFDQELLRVLRSVIDQGVAEGWSADETAIQIQKAFQGVSSTTAQMLAQTELTSLVNERSLQAAQKASSGKAEPTYKVWQTMKDPRVRPAHASVQGQTVPIDQPFDVGGFSMMYPGDPAAPMRLVARCRCRMTYTETLVASAKEDTLMSSMATDTTNEQLTAGIVVTITEVEEAEDAVEDATEGGVEEDMSWRALLAIEGQATEDGRIIDVGALSWRDLPLSLMAMDETGPGGHEGAAVAGRIDTITREGNELWGTGVFDTGEFGQKVCRMVGEQTLRGNSVDLAVLAYEYRNADTGEVLTDEQLMDAFFGEDIPILFAVTEGVIMASTVCPTPAIAGAEIMLASGRDWGYGPLNREQRRGWNNPVLMMSFSFVVEAGEVLTAAAAGMAPLHPPLDWFSDPHFDGPTPLTVTKDGQVKGHAALWNSCHIGEPSGPGICVPPPRSGMNYEIFHHGVVETSEGVDVPCGQITMSTFHAGRDLSWKATLEHYEHSGCAVADVVAGEDRHGIWVSGGLRPDLPAEKVRELKAGALSGDWRQVIGRGLEFLAALVVNIPGFPIPRPEARIVASALGEEEVLALVAAGMVTEEDIEGMSRREYLRKIEVLTH